jgi:cobalt-zinc-cadmium efflux system outer membrane protein
MADGRWQLADGRWQNRAFENRDFVIVQSSSPVHISVIRHLPSAIMKFLPALLVLATLAHAQVPVGRADVITAALARGPRVALARADSAAARAQLSLARQFENPTFGASYSKSTPQNHFSFDVPLDYPWLRSARVGAAQSGLGAASYRCAFERAAITFVADTTYTRAIAANRRSDLSRRTSADADSLLVLATLRRDAGDASELDVQLARVNAGQLANVAARDSLDAITQLLVVQAVMGLPADAPTIALADTLDAGVAAPDSAQGTQLLVAAAEEELRAADQLLTLERRRLFAAPALSLGWEQRDPTGSETGTLPTIGVSLPLPLFNQNRGAILAAQAQRDRSQAALALSRIEGAAQLASARRGATLARQRVARSQRLLDGAARVASLSLLAYREGAVGLPSVLESLRTSREAAVTYVDDLAGARNAAGVVRLLTLTANGTRP